MFLLYLSLRCILLHFLNYFQTVTRTANWNTKQQRRYSLLSLKIFKENKYIIQKLRLFESEKERKIVAPGKVALELVQGDVELDVLAAVEARHLHLGQLLQDPGPAPQFGLKGLQKFKYLGLNKFRSRLNFFNGSSNLKIKFPSGVLLKYGTPKSDDA